MDAIVMLREDHAAVETLFKKLESGDLGVVPRICDELTRTHTSRSRSSIRPCARTWRTWTTRCSRRSRSTTS